jgi:hypothetical protein
VSAKSKPRPMLLNSMKALESAYCFGPSDRHVLGVRA